MGLSALKGTEVYQYVSTWIPRKADVIETQLYEECKIQVHPRYMNTLGTMCDYGVRVRNHNHEFGYIQMGMAMRGDIPEINKLITKDYLTAEEAYILSTYRETGKFKADKLSEEMWNAYAVITERAIGLYRYLRLVDPFYGRYYRADGCVHSIECDCASDKSIIDMKVSRTCAHNKEYWTQVVLYSLLAYRRDKRSRNRVGLVYPVQGVVKQFIFDPQEYVALRNAFNTKYGKDSVD